jgi:hypothetical protein
MLKKVLLGVSAFGLMAAAANAEEKVKMSELLNNGYKVVSVVRQDDYPRWYIFLQLDASLFLCDANINANVCFEMKD